VRSASGEQQLQRLEHVLVAQVPRLVRAVVHDPVVALGGGHHARVLQRIEVALAVARRVVEAVAQELHEGRHHVVLTDREAARQRSASVERRIALPRRQAAIAQAGHRGRLRIDALQVAKDGADRAVEAVDVEAVEADPALRLDASVVLAQPLHELPHLLVAPHPGREAGERRLLGRPLRR
jgi:hypothetical protein